MNTVFLLLLMGASSVEAPEASAEPELPSPLSLEQAEEMSKALK